ncbi:MAG: 4Fe-4S dicluster domain-containing protein [Candidatus Thorarchaeota archaeon]
MGKTNSQKGTLHAHVPSSEFSREIASVPGGEDINKCVQCGICTASCMVASYEDKYRPRKLIQKILLGEREEVLNSELPWLCMTCRLCEERCQEGVSLADIFHAVREIAASENRIPKAFANTVEVLFRDGWLLKDAYTDFIEEDREALGLRTKINWNNEFSKRVKQRFVEGGTTH